ncbi:MAG: acyl transferase [Crocinitomicaceae bacterium]|nr:acyl transferase [Crocinitomicaceae bacterium]
MIELEKEIFELKSVVGFEKVALKVFAFQREHCSVYREFVNMLHVQNPKSLKEIPFLPISFFKSHEVRSETRDVETIFKSSGTTGMIRSQHFVESTEMYRRSFLSTYIQQLGKLEDQVILALLPNYVEQGSSSLVYMVDALIEGTSNPLSKFYLNDLNELLLAYQLAIQTNKKVIIFGVSYALLDLAALKPDLSQAIIIETGGMKGRRKEMTKEELHLELKTAFQVPYISSEYGMAELLSQAYSDQDGLFSFSPWMKTLIRDVNDPFHYLADGKTGGINVVDLANLYSCSFISTQDLGKIQNEQLQLMGRFDNSEIRGCNLMVE